MDQPRCLDCDAELERKPGVTGIGKLGRKIPALVCPVDYQLFATQDDGEVVRLAAPQ